MNKVLISAPVEWVNGREEDYVCLEPARKRSDAFHDPTMSVGTLFCLKGKDQSRLVKEDILKLVEYVNDIPLLECADKSILVGYPMTMLHMELVKNE